MLDISDVYMNIYLPTLEAGQVKIGNDARILLDAYPDHPIRPKVTFLATQAQFTPKAVETKSERDKLMFRVKVRIDPDLLIKYGHLEKYPIWCDDRRSSSQRGRSFNPWPLIEAA